MRFSFVGNIRSHLLLLVLISVLPALGIIVYSGLERSRHEIEEAESDALQAVRNFSYDHERAVETTRQFLMTLAKVPDIQNLNVSQSNKLLGELLNQNPFYSTLFVVNAQGVLHASGTPLPPTPLNLGARKYFQDALRIKDFSVGEYAICPAVKRSVLHFAYPVSGTLGEFKGVVAVSLDFARYARMFPMRKLPEGSTLSFSDHKGIFLYRFPEQEDNIPKPELPEMIKKMSPQPEGVFTSVGADGLRFLYAYRKLRTRANESPYLFICVGIPEEKALAHVRRCLAVNVLLLAFAFVIAVTVAWFLGNFIIVGRLNRLVEASRRLGHGDLNARTGLDYKQGELGEVGKAFDEMAETLERKSTEREQAEEKIKKVAEEWQTTFDSITDLVMISDTECRIVRVNKETIRFFNLPIDQIVGQYFTTLIPGADKSPEECPAGRGMRRKDHQETEVYFAEKGLWLFVSADPIRDGKGDTLGLVLVVKDISDRKRSEEALRESEKKFRTLTEKSVVGVYLHQEGIWKYVNKKFAEMHGCTVEEMVDKMNTTDFVVLEDLPLVEENRRKGDSGEAVHYEMRERTKDGRMIDVEIMSSPTTYQGKPATMGTALDITNRKRAEEKLRESEEIFRQLAENGQGYPLGIRGEEIPVECRLLAIADAYEALTSVRPYRRAFSHAEAVAELLSHTGTQFDPYLLEKFVQMLETRPPESGFHESFAV